MKKLINLVSLVVLTSVNVFTPFSYAQEDTINVANLNAPDITYYNVAGEERAIMAYNLGATEVGVECNTDMWDANTGACGGFYQRGNNRIFSKNFLDSDEANIFNFDYFEGNYSRGEGERGPCPEGYHIPTSNEWYNLFLQWCEDSDVCDVREFEYRWGEWFGWGISEMRILLLNLW